MDTAYDTFAPITRNIHQHGHTYTPAHYLTPTILHTTLLPTFSINTALGLTAAVFARATQNSNVDVDRAVYAVSPALVTFSSALLLPIARGMKPGTALGRLSRPEWLILGGVALWSGKSLLSLLTLPSSSSSSSYASTSPSPTEKNTEEPWTSSARKILLNAAVQSLIALPLTGPFTDQGAVLTGYSPISQSVSVAVFCAGLFLSGAAESQRSRLLSAQSTSDGSEARNGSEAGNGTEARNGKKEEGVASLVRYPDLLADLLVNSSFTGLLWASDMLAPVYLVGPLVNYMYLSSKAAEADAEAARDVGKLVAPARQNNAKNAILPAGGEVGNPWLWAVICGGAFGAGIEWFAAGYLY